MRTYGYDLTLPAPVSVVLHFIADRAEHLTERGSLAHELPPEIDRALVSAKVKRLPGPFTPATVRHRLAVLSAVHESRALRNPCRSREVQTVMARLRAAYARRGVSPARKDALTRESFEQLLATCDDSLIGLRDRALLLFGWASGGAPTVRDCARDAGEHASYRRRVPVPSHPLKNESLG